jgi:hypothetical protein
VVHFQCCNGWPSGPAARPARAPAGPEPGPRPAGGRDPIRGRLEVRAGPGRGPVRAWSRAQSRLALRGFRLQAGGAAAGPSDFGRPGSAHTVPTRAGHFVAVSALCCCVRSLVDYSTRGLLDGPGSGPGGELCLDAIARLSGSLVAPRGFSRAGLRPISLPRAVRWPGLSPGRRLHRRPEPLGVIELTHLVALVSSSLSSLRSALEASVGRWSGGPLPSLFGCTAGPKIAG